jgi:hypothetical protein
LFLFSTHALYAGACVPWPLLPDHAALNSFQLFSNQVQTVLEMLKLSSCMCYKWYLMYL